jgi:glycosyltransferase involved in cell wall biosynthesis
MSLPLVSCIMPTKNRREFVPKAIEYFLRQTYPNKKLVIGDDGDPVHDLIDSDAVERTDAVVHYRQFKAGQTLGAKRNALVEACTGDSLIAHWDDDDWYGPERLAIQVAHMQADGAEVCGVDTPLFYDLITGTSFRYRYKGRGGYLYSATLMYTRDYWARSLFPDVQVGASTPFVCGPGRLDNAAIQHRDKWYTGIGHMGNNSPKNWKASEFTLFDGDMYTRLGGDWPFYEGLRERMGVAA